MFTRFTNIIVLKDERNKFNISKDYNIKVKFYTN